MSLNLDSLNPQQREAVTTTAGAVLVLAGAGSGKTRVITARIAHMIRDKRIPSDNVLAVTFTNKAAGEMAQRVGGMLPKSAGKPLICTFHALGVRMLRANIHLLGYRPGFAIYDTQDQLRLVQGLLDEDDFEGWWSQPKDALHAVQRARGQGLDAAELKRHRDSAEDLRLGELLGRYEDTLRRMNAVDFEDLLHLPLRLCREHPHEARDWFARFRYVMVDEYQDTNRSQYALMREIVRPHGNLCVVGDDDQSIYGWRGAEPENIRGFERDFPGARVIRLEQNYRSTDVILQAANQVITHNAERKDKRLWGRQGKGEGLHWLVADSEREELEQVVTHLHALRRRSGAPLSDFAILYRSNHQSRAIEELLREEGIPYYLVGGTRFYDRKEVRDAVAYLRVIHNSQDEVSLFRVLNFPRRGIGKTSQMRLLDYANHQARPVFDLLGDAAQLSEIPPATARSMEQFSQLIGRYRRRLQNEPLGETFRELLGEVGFHRALEKEYNDSKQREKAVGIVSELEYAVDQFTRTREDPSLKAFLEHAALMAMPQEDEADNRRPMVTLMTVHSAKGLEFPHVFVIGMAEESFPNKRAMEEGAEEEERRLAYVAITRARESLTFSMAKVRKRYSEVVHQRPSRFVLEIDPSLFEGPVPEGARKASQETREERIASARNKFFERVRRLRAEGESA